VIAASLGVLMILSACQTQTAPIPEITIQATEYAFDAPDPVSVGGGAGQLQPQPHLRRRGVVHPVLGGYD
jgi:hypothetical protein